MMDPAAFMANPAQFNPAAAGQFANPQQMPSAMQNGPMRNVSPSFQNPVYQTNSVVPSKRPRPREDSMGASPRQNPGMLPTSRADTPQQSPYPGFQPNAMQQQQAQQQQHAVGQPQQYPHLQPNGSGTASPSPVMAGNQIRPGSVPQRVNTASPHPFSPASGQFGPQASPVPSEHGGTPQPNPYMQNQNFPQGFSQSYTPSPSPARPPSGQNPMGQQMMPQQMGQVGQMGQMGHMGQMPQMPQMGQMGQPMPQMHPSQMAQMQQMQQMQQQMAAQHAGRGAMDPAQQQKMMYQMRLQQQLQQGNMHMAAQMQAQNIGQGRGMMPNNSNSNNKPPMPMPMANGQMPPGAMKSQQSQMARQNPDSFMKNLVSFMNMQRLPLETNPQIDGRPVNLLQLFLVMGKFGSYRTVMARNAWGQVAAAVGFPAQFPSAPSQIKAIYEKNLLKFEEAWNKQKGRNQQMATPAGMPTAPGPGTPQRMGAQGQMPQGQQHQPVQPPGQPPQMPPSHQTPVKTPSMQQANVNGFPTPQQGQISQQPPVAAPGHLRNSLSRSVDTTPVAGDFPMPSPSSTGKAGSISMPTPHVQHDHAQVATGPTLSFPAPLASQSDEYMPNKMERMNNAFGGFELGIIAQVGAELEQWRPDVPPPLELGQIDVHALIKSLQCGIRGEVRLALDTLGTVTHESWRHPNLMLDLRGCDDLVESLIDCAEEQADELADASKPISDEIDLPSYEDVLRLCRMEQYSVKKISMFGDAESELEHAADRLIAITTILRNLSFHEPNQSILADETVVKFLCSTIRSLGTLENLLRSSKNTLDFMKDVIVLLSNIAGALELPGKEQAFCLLQLLLAFAPSPAPSMTGDNIVFAPFEPAVHPYMPHAVDSLAKLLARDEPNRSHYKIIFAADASSSPLCELLTRTFALAICSIPDQNKESRPANLPSFIEARKPVIMQGLLAADIIASLAPGYESGVTRAWLSSGEGFAQNLFRLVRTLCTQAEPIPLPTTRGARAAQPREDTDVLHIITWGVSTLRRLSEKARDPNDPRSIPPNALPTKESLFGALQSLKSPKWTALLNQLSSYAGLDC